jgi:hypothetical protein
MIYATLKTNYGFNDGFIMHKVVKNDTLRKKVQNYVQNYVHGLNIDTKSVK